ncbi:MAG: ATP-binding protein [Myxococcales bacterium]|nr:ATP-binding protein [Myxococcales bacterium]
MDLESGTPLVLKRALRPSAEAQARLRLELSLAQEVISPNVLRYLELSKFGAETVLLLEDFAAEPLSQRLRHRTLEASEFFEIAIRIADAVVAVHAAGLIHGDIKPDNLLVARGSLHCKLGDFSHARMAGLQDRPASAPHREDGGADIGGTLGYMAPELLGRHRRRIDQRSDLFALGVTLYEALAGCNPFLGKDDLATAHALRTLDPPSLLQYRTDIPDALDALVRRLLARRPELRYQRAESIAKDLQRCKGLLQDGRVHDAITLGGDDPAPLPSLPAGAIGREAVLDRLLGIFTAAGSGTGVQIVACHGAAGIGKSHLIGALVERISGLPSAIVIGRHEPRHRSIPFSGIVNSVSDLLRPLMASPRSELRKHRERLFGALGGNVELMADLVPPLAQLLEVQGAHEAVASTRSQQRVHQAVSDLLTALFDSSQPVLWIVEDLHWMDAQSFDLLAALFCERRVGPLMLVMTYRDNDDVAQKVRSFLDCSAHSGHTITDLVLEPLDQHAVTEFVAEMLDWSRARANPLAAELHSKSKGHPLLLTELLRELHATGALRTDRDEGGFVWTPERSADPSSLLGLTELIQNRARKLSQRCQRTLGVAASLGNTVNASSLMVAMPELGDLASVRQALAPAVAEGLLEPHGFTDDDAVLEDPRWSFTHATTARTCQSLVGREVTLAARHRFGVWTLSDRIPNGSSHELIDGLILLDGIDVSSIESSQIPNLVVAHLEGAYSAAAQGAFALALQLAERGLTLASSLADEDSRDAVFELTCCIIECHTNLGELQEARSLIEGSNKAPVTTRFALRFGKAHVALELAAERWNEAVATGLAVLAARSYDIEEAARNCDADALLDRAVSALDELQARNSDPDPEAPAPAVDAELQLLSELISPVYVTRPELLPHLAWRFIDLALTHGVSALCATGFTLMGVLLLLLRRDAETSYRMGLFGVSLARTFGDDHVLGRQLITFAGITSVRKEPLRRCIALHDECHRACVQSGDQLYAGYALLSKMLLEFSSGTDLLTLKAEVEEAQRYVTRTLNPSRVLLESLTGLIDSLRGADHDLGSFDAAGDTDRATVDAMRQRGFDHGVQLHALYKGLCTYLLEGHEAAIPHLEQSGQYLAGAAGQLSTVEHGYIYGLARLASLGDASTDEVGSQLDEIIDEIGIWADACSETFSAKHLLLRAERDRVVGRRAEAIDGFAAATQAAEDHGLLWEVGITTERAAIFHRALGHSLVAEAYMRRACVAFGQWGATKKVQMLVTRYPDMLDVSRPSGGFAPTVQSTATVDAHLEATALVRAGRALSENTDLRGVVDTTVEILCEMSGSNFARAVLAIDDELVVADQMTSDRSLTLVGSPLDRYNELPRTLVRYVYQSGEAASHTGSAPETDLGADPYYDESIRGHGLALPLAIGGERHGVIYLERPAGAPAFEPGVRRSLSLLLPQAAIAVGHVKLFTSLNEEIARRTRAEHALASHADSLEEQIVERERSLREAQRDLLQSERLATLGRLAATVSHELRNPLGAISSGAFVIERKLEGYDDEVVARNLARIVQAIGQCNHIIDELLEYTRSTELGLNRVVLDAWLEQTLSSLTVNSRIELVWRPDAPGVEVELDERRMARVIDNVVTNAAQAMVDPDGRALGPLPPRIEVTTGSGNFDGIEICIRDTGIGISEEHRDRLFEPLFSTKTFGVGLGLTIVRQIVAQHGGRIELNPRPGGGTEVRISIPRHHTAVDLD